MATTKQIEAHKRETNWPAILDQLGGEKFRSDISKRSAKELEFIHQFASLGKGELAAHRFSHKFQREYFARLVEKDLLIRTGRGGYNLYTLCLASSYNKPNETAPTKQEPSAPERGGQLAAAFRPPLQ